MKTFFRLAMLIVAVAFFGVATQAQTRVTDTLKVSGNCEMCRTRITESCFIRGVKSADWNPETQNLIVTYNPKRTTLQAIAEKIASVGHDTKLVKATDKAYGALPNCCQYREATNPMK